MAVGLWTRLKRALAGDRGTGRGGDDAKAEAGVADAGRPTTDGGTSVGLYECPRCELTYVSEGKESCRGCGEDVEPIANERELGIL